MRIGYKKVLVDVRGVNKEAIATLQIIGHTAWMGREKGQRFPEARGAKCRTSKVKVLQIQDFYERNYKVGKSLHSKHFLYKVGKIVVPDGFDPDPYVECTRGIHFFYEIDQAKRY